jgi:adenosylhomocysteine nucleosidase
MSDSLDRRCWAEWNSNSEMSSVSGGYPAIFGERPVRSCKIDDSVRALLLLVVFFCISIRAHGAQDSAGIGPVDTTPRIGILLPLRPVDYTLFTSAVADSRTEHVGPFDFTIGTIDGIPVVINIASEDGPLLRCLAAQAMVTHYNVRVAIYPGTSGAALGADQIHVGDVVLGAKNIEIGMFFMDNDGTIGGNEFESVKGQGPHGDFYADPRLLGMLACSATQEVHKFDPPRWLNPSAPNAKPAIFYFGAQGTTTMWIQYRPLLEKIHNRYHPTSEDGDWFSNLAAALYGVPFVEVSVIANSIYEFPKQFRGRSPSPLNGDDSNFVAQALSNRIALNLIRRFGQGLLTGEFTNPKSSPFPASYFADPKNPRQLMEGMDCK